MLIANVSSFILYGALISRPHWSLIQEWTTQIGVVMMFLLDIAHNGMFPPCMIYIVNLSIK